MDPIYVTGHRNPDTDSIVAAIAYAALRNSLGDREYVAARLGHISDETHRILERFDFQPPVHAAKPLRLYLPFGNLLSKVFLYASHTVPYRLSRKFLQAHDFRIAQSYFHQIAGSDI